MRSHWFVLGLFVPAITHAQPADDDRRGARGQVAEVVAGSAMLAGSYAGAVLWAQQSDGDQDALYVPLVGPWLELFGLPDCAEREVFCEHSTATRAVLIADGAVPMIGAALIIDGLARRHEAEQRVLIAPSAASGGPGVVVSGRF
jgi:hypothetical protein